VANPVRAETTECQPPRFLAYGVDRTARTRVFVVDGKRPTYLGTFIESMLRAGLRHGRTASRIPVDVS
jgi:hypothetical protein